MKLVIDKTEIKFTESTDYEFLTNKNIRFNSFISFIAIYKR